MTDPFAFIAEQGKYPEFLENRIPHFLTGSQDLPMSGSDDSSSSSSIYDSPDLPVASTGIIIRSLPEQADDEDEFHSAADGDSISHGEEQHMRNDNDDGVVEQSELRVDTVELGPDTDLLFFSEENEEKKDIFMPKSDDENKNENESVVGGEVGGGEFIRGCKSGVKRKEPATPTEELESTERILNDSVDVDVDVDVDVEKGRECHMEGIEDGGPNVRSNANANAAERELALEGEVNPVISTEKIDLNSKEVEHSLEINEKNVGANKIGYGRGENQVGDGLLKYVKLDDLLPRDDGKDFNLLETAIKGGMLFPRPTWWKPEGYAKN